MSAPHLALAAALRARLAVGAAQDGFERQDDQQVQDAFEAFHGAIHEALRGLRGV